MIQSDFILTANMFKTPTQFCHETTKFVEICLQHMPMDLIPELDDVTILLSNLQKNHSVRAGYLSIIVWHSNCLQLEQRVVKINALYRQRICDDALMNLGCWTQKMAQALFFPQDPIPKYHLNISTQSQMPAHAVKLLLWQCWIE